MKKHNNAELNSFVGCFVEFEPASSSHPPSCWWCSIRIALNNLLMTSVHCPQNKKQQQYFFFIFVDLKTKRIPRLKAFLHVFF